MRKILFMVLAGLFVAAATAQANCGRCGMGDMPKAQAQEPVKRHLDKMAKDLKLSDEQKARVEVIMKEKMEKKDRIMKEKMVAMDALHEEFKAKLKGVLSEEQMKKWEAGQEHKGEMKGKCPYCKDGKMCAHCQKEQGKVN